MAKWVLTKVGSDIVEDFKVCGGELPKELVPKKPQKGKEKEGAGKAALRKALLSYFWREPKKGEVLTARGLVREIIPRLWICELQEDSAMVLAEYLASVRAVSRRYLDVWFRHCECWRGCEVMLQMRCGSWYAGEKICPYSDSREMCKCPCCGACVKETLEHYLFRCHKFEEERRVMVQRIRERCTSGDVELLIRKALGLGSLLNPDAGELRACSCVGDELCPTNDTPKTIANRSLASKVNSDDTARIPEKGDAKVSDLKTNLKLPKNEKNDGIPGSTPEPSKLVSSPAVSAPTSSTESTESQDLVGADQSNQVRSTTNRDLIREDLEITDTAKTRIKTRTRTGSRMEEFFKVSKSELVKEEAKNPSPSAPPTATMVVVGKRRGKRRPNLSAGQLKVDALMKRRQCLNAVKPF